MNTNKINILNEAMRGFSKHFRQLTLLCHINIMLVFPGGSDCKESVCSTGNMGSIPGSERSPRGGNCNPLRYFCLGNRVDGQRILAGNESDTTYRPKTRRNVLLVWAVTATSHMQPGKAGQVIPPNSEVLLNPEVAENSKVSNFKRKTLGFQRFSIRNSNISL